MNRGDDVQVVSRFLLARSAVAYPVDAARQSDQESCVELVCERLI